MNRLKLILIMAMLVFVPTLFSGCIVYTVADTTVSVAASGVKIVAKTVETAIDVVTPSSSKE